MNHPFPITSRKLLAAIGNGPGATRWTEFFHKYTPGLRDYATRHFPSLEADDLIQDTFLVLVKRLKTYQYDPKAKGAFHNYLTGILKHKALYRRRVAARHAKDVVAFRDSAERVDDSRVMDEEQKWKETVFAIAVRQLMADETIQDRTKQVFLRVAINHESPDAVADSFGLKRNAVDQMKSRMMTKLREIVESLKAVV